MDLKKATKGAYDMSRRLPELTLIKRTKMMCVELPKGGKFTSGGQTVVLACPQ